MRKRYQAVMEHLTIDDTMRERVLEHVSAANLRPVAAKHMSFRRWGAAACVALLVLGGTMMYRFQSPWPSQLVDQPSSQVTVVSPVTSVDSAEALEALVGFPMETIPELSFTPETVTYTAIQGKIAQCSYQQGEQTAILRKARGTEDPSGDYTEYEQVSSLDFQGIIGELHGKEDAFTAAWWTDGTYAWSLTLSDPIPQAEWENLLTALLASAAS